MRNDQFKLVLGDLSDFYNSAGNTVTFDMSGALDYVVVLLPAGVSKYITISPSITAKPLYISTSETSVVVRSYIVQNTYEPLINSVSNQGVVANMSTGATIIQLQSNMNTIIKATGPTTGFAFLVVSTNSYLQNVNFYRSLVAALTTPSDLSYVQIGGLNQTALLVPQMSTIASTTISSTLQTGSKLSNFTLINAKGQFDIPNTLGTSSFSTGSAITTDSTQHFQLFFVQSKTDQTVGTGEKLRVTYAPSTATPIASAFTMTTSKVQTINLLNMNYLPSQTIPLTIAYTASKNTITTFIVSYDISNIVTLAGTSLPANKTHLFVVAAYNQASATFNIGLPAQTSIYNIKIVGNTIDTAGLNVSGNSVAVYDSVAGVGKRLAQDFTGTIFFIYSTVATTKTPGAIVFYCSAASVVYLQSKSESMTLTSNNISSALQKNYEYKQVNCAKDSINLVTSVYSVFATANQFMTLTFSVSQTNGIVGLLEFDSTLGLTTTFYNFGNVPVSQDTASAPTATDTVTGKLGATNLQAIDQLFGCYNCASGTCFIEEIASQSIIDITGTNVASKITLYGIAIDPTKSSSMTSITNIENAINSTSAPATSKLLKQINQVFTGSMCFYMKYSSHPAAPNADVGFYITSKTKLTRTTLKAGTLTQPIVLADVGSNIDEKKIGTYASNVTGSGYNSITVDLDGALSYGDQVLTGTATTTISNIWVCGSESVTFACSTLSNNYYQKQYPLALASNRYLSVIANYSAAEAAVANLQFTILQPTSSVSASALTLVNRAGLSGSLPQITYTAGNIFYKSSIVALTGTAADIPQKVRFQVTAADTNIDYVIVYLVDASTSIKAKTPSAILISTTSDSNIQDLTIPANKDVIIVQSMRSGLATNPTLTFAATLTQLNTTIQLDTIPTLATKLQFDPAATSDFVSTANGSQLLGPLQQSWYSFSNLDAIKDTYLLIKAKDSKITASNLGFFKYCELTATIRTKLNLVETENAKAVAIATANVIVNTTYNMVMIKTNEFYTSTQQCFMKIKNNSTTEIGELQLQSVNIVPGFVSTLFTETDFFTTSTIKNVNVSSGQTVQLQVMITDASQLQQILIESPAAAITATVTASIVDATAGFASLSAVTFTSQKSILFELRNGKIGQVFNIQLKMAAAATGAPTVTETYKFTLSSLIQQIASFEQLFLLTDATNTTVVSNSFATESKKVTYVILKSANEVSLYNITTTSDTFTTGFSISYAAKATGDLTFTTGTALASSGAPLKINDKISLLQSDTTLNTILIKIQNDSNATINTTFTFTKLTPIAVTLPAATTITAKQDATTGELTSTVNLVAEQATLLDDKKSVYFTITNQSTIANRFITLSFVESAETSANFSLSFFYSAKDTDKLTSSKGRPAIFVNNTVKIFMPPTDIAAQVIVYGSYKGSLTGKIKIDLSEPMVADLVATQKVDPVSTEYTKFVKVTTGTTTKALNGKFDVTKLSPGESTFTTLTPADIQSSTISVFVQAGTTTSAHNVTIYELRKATTSTVISLTKNAAAKTSYTVTGGSQVDIATSVTNGVVVSGTGTQATPTTTRTTTAAIHNLNSLKSQLRSNQTTATTTQAIVQQVQINTDETQPVVAIQGSYILGNDSSSSSSSSSWNNLYILAIVLPILAVIVIIVVVVVVVMKKKGKLGKKGKNHVEN